MAKNKYLAAGWPTWSKCDLFIYLTEVHTFCEATYQFALIGSFSGQGSECCLLSGWNIYGFFFFFACQQENTSCQSAGLSVYLH